MPRKPRSKSPTGYFHVTLRGNGGQLLFDDAEDRIAMLQILDAIIPKHNIELIAWCLMGNHIHLLIDDPDDRKSDAMHAVAVSYAGRYNARTGHIGHVFQERFWDSPIKSEVYLLEAIRYIHLNPQKAGLAAYDEYPWSSHREYLMSARSRPHVTGSVSVFYSQHLAHTFSSWKVRRRFPIAPAQQPRFARKIYANLARQSCRVSQDVLRRNSNPSPSHFAMRRFSRFEKKG